MDGDRPPRPPIIARLRSAFLWLAGSPRENVWALLLATLLILTVTLATMGVQPEFVYKGF